MTIARTRFALFPLLLFTTFVACTDTDQEDGLAVASDASAEAVTPAGPAPEATSPRGVTLFAEGAIPSEWENYRVTFTPSGDTAYFAAGAQFFPFSREATIYEMVREGAGWSSPTPAPFSGTHSDIDPFVAPDGRHLYFSSIRPMEGELRDAVDLWRVPREGLGWGTPERLTISSARDDLFPSVDGEGRLYFGRPLTDPERNGEWGIWVAEPRMGSGEGGQDTSISGWEEPIPLGEEVNLPGWWTFNPTVSSDGTLLLFTRLNPQDGPGTGFGDIHLSRRSTGSGWSPALSLSTEVNTPADEFHPSLSRDGRTLYFIRRDPRVEGDVGRLHAVPLEEVLP